MLDQLIETANAAYIRGDWDEALAEYETALTMVSADEDPGRRADLLRRVGAVHRNRGDLDQAWELYVASREVAEAADLRDRLGEALNALAIVEMRRGRREEAAVLYLEARAIGEELGDDRLVAMVDQNMGILANIE